MSSRANIVLGIVLLAATLIVFGGIARYAAPRMLETHRVTASAEPVAELPNTATLLPPTSTPMQTPTSTEEPTATATATATATPTAEPTETPTDEPTPTELAVVAAAIVEETATPDGPTPTPDVMQLRATRDAALFAEAGGLGGRTGYYVPTGQQAWVFGRSEDGRWLHIRHQLGDEGWAAASYFDVSRSQIFSIDLSSFVGTANPNVTVRATQVAQVNPTNTPLPVFPTNTPRPAFPTPRPTNPPRPTNTPWPTNTPRVQPTATWVIPTPVPTNPPAPVPTTAPGGQGGSAQTNAVAWWQIDQPTVANNGNGTWRADLVIRVPTSFQYTFDLPFLTRNVLRDRNLGGDDYFVLTVSGMGCGTSLNAPLIARQNGARMLVFNEFTLEQGPIFVAPPC